MFRFTVRELVLLTVIVALGVASWLVNRQATAVTRKNDLLRRELRSILYNYEKDTGKRIGIMLEDGEFIRPDALQGMPLSGRG